MSPGADIYVASRYRGAGTPTHDLPPSVVRTTEVHGRCAHGAVPSTQPSLGDMKVIEMGSKPAGTGPPGGIATVAGIPDWLVPLTETLLPVLAGPVPAPG